MVFLMYRVELKDHVEVVYYIMSSLVPNVPCGVESMVVWYSTPLGGTCS
jgi:hypothetical protein